MKPLADSVPADCDDASWPRMRASAAARAFASAIHAEEISKASAFAQERAEREARLARPQFVMPTRGVWTSGFGYRWGRMHEGIDIAVPEGTPIRAAKAGTVAIAAYTGGYGNYTCIDHGGGIATCYAHQASFAVGVGASVAQGQVIGYSDCTGHCFGPHLHFEVRVNGTPVDPLGYL